MDLDYALFAGSVLMGCGRAVQEANIAGPDDGSTTLARLSKAAVLAEENRAGVIVIVTKSQPKNIPWDGVEVGLPMEGVEVSFSHSVAGRQKNFRWQGTTNVDGIAEIEMMAPPEMSASGKGLSGYYVAQATDSATGETLGEWASIPINAGKEHVISLPIGGKSRTTSGSGPLEASLMGAAGFDFDPQPFPSGTVGWNSTLVMHRNVKGEVWGLVMGYNILIDISSPPPMPDSDAPNWYIAWEQVVTCFDVDLESNRAWYMVRATHVNPAGFGRIGSENAGFFQDNGGPSQDAYGVAGIGEPRFPDFKPECGSRWEQAQLSVPEMHNLRLIRHSELSKPALLSLR